MQVEESQASAVMRTESDGMQVSEATEESEMQGITRQESPRRTRSQVMRESYQESGRVGGRGGQAAARGRVARKSAMWVF